MFKLLKVQKRLSKQQTLIQLLEFDTLKNLTQQILENELLPLIEISENITKKYINAIQEQDIIFVPINNIKNLLSEIIQIIETPQEQLIVIKIKKLLAKLYLENQTFPQILNYLIINSQVIQLDYCFQLEQELLYQLETIENHFISDEQINNIANRNNIEIILLTLDQLYKTLESPKQIIKNQQDSQNLEKLYNQSQNIISKSKKINKICRIISDIREMNQLKIQISQSTNFEERKRFILKILLMLLFEQNKPFPDVLKALKYSYCSAKMNDYRGMIVVSVQAELIDQLCQIKLIQNQLKILKINPTLNKNHQFTNYKQIRQSVELHYPHYIKLTLDQVILMQIQLILKKINNLIRDVANVLQESSVIILQKKIDKQCGQQINNILNGKIKFEEAQKEFNNTNILHIGYLLKQITKKVKATEEGEIHSDSIDNLVNTQVKLTVEKQNALCQKMNPFYQHFLKIQCDKNRPFPFILRTMRMIKGSLSISYKQQHAKELTLNYYFQKFMKKEYGLQLTDDTTQNLNSIFQLKIKPKKYGVSWPNIIRKQLELIYDQKEFIKNQLMYLKQEKNFQETVSEYEQMCETKINRQIIQDIILSLAKYLLSLNE